MTQPICLTVKYELAFVFRQKVEAIEGCKITNVIELLTCKMLQYWIECPKDKENIITDMAFMTWIKNPVLQKYYHGTKEFEDISNKYINGRIEKSDCKMCALNKNNFNNCIFKDCPNA